MNGREGKSFYVDCSRPREKKKNERDISSWNRGLKDRAQSYQESTPCFMCRGTAINRSEED